MRHHQNRPLRIETLETRRVLTGGILEEVSDFSLIDVNPTSKTYNQLVSPRDYLGQVSAWYFGHAT